MSNTYQLRNGQLVPMDGQPGGSSRAVGELVYTLLPIKSLAHRLLDGTWVTDVIYKAFVDYVKSIRDGGEHTSLFCTNEEFETSLATYGVCGKFVVEDARVRLPKVTGFVEGTVDAAAVGSLVEAGLPNITGGLDPNTDTGGIPLASLTGVGAFYYASENRVATIYGTKDGNGYGVYFDASHSNPIYDNSNTVQPQSIKGYVYMIVATAVKSEIVADVDGLTSLALESAGPTPAYHRPTVPTVSKTDIIMPEGLMLKVNGQLFKLGSNTQVSLTPTAANRKGKDVYLYAVNDGGTLKFATSLSKTNPEGYSAEVSRLIGGVHCLCADVGTISGHTLSGYVAGDILPTSIWDLRHRAKSDNAGMVYVPHTDLWWDIYLASFSGALQSVFGGTTADGASATKFHGEKFNEEFSKVLKRLPYRDEFVVAAWGSNEQTVIKGAADAGTTGGHVDTAGRRMISNWGLEDCCGFLWQWVRDQGGKGVYGDGVYGYGGTTPTSGWEARPTYDHDNHSGNGVYHSGVDPKEYGDDYGVLYRLLVGGGWSNSSFCGPRSVLLSVVSARVYADYGARGVSEPRSRFV